MKLSIDDYGSGFATSSYLIKIPVAIVKIDKDILWSAMEDKMAMFILKSTIEMIRGLGKEIVVEGVETEDMINALNEINENLHFQGFYYSKPVPEDEFLRFLSKNTA